AGTGSRVVARVARVARGRRADGAVLPPARHPQPGGAGGPAVDRHAFRPRRPSLLRTFGLRAGLGEPAHGRAARALPREAVLPHRAALLSRSGRGPDARGMARPRALRRGGDLHLQPGAGLAWRAGPGRLDRRRGDAVLPRPAAAHADPHRGWHGRGNRGGDALLRRSEVAAHRMDARQRLQPDLHRRQYLGFRHRPACLPHLRARARHARRRPRRRARRRHGPWPAGPAAFLRGMGHGRPRRCPGPGLRLCLRRGMPVAGAAAFPADAMPARAVAGGAKLQHLPLAFPADPGAASGLWLDPRHPRPGRSGLPGLRRRHLAAALPRRGARLPVRGGPGHGLRPAAARTQSGAGRPGRLRVIAARRGL
ncbi:MAG: hypothetical protein AVDCRST_MAG27-1819, partial [uncultured Craurococcus sp.]